MIERIVNCFRNDYDVFIVILIILISVKSLNLYHKHETKNDKERAANLTKPFKDIISSIRFDAIFINILMICGFYLFFRFAGVLPNQLSSHP